MATTDRRGVPVDSTDTIIAGDPSPGLAIKAPVRVATTGSNIALTGLQTIDGVLLAAGDRVLVKDQTDQTTNGIYAASTGIWTRTTDAAGNGQWVDGTMVAVNSGTVFGGGGVLMRCLATDPIVIGTSPITFVIAGALNPSYPVEFDSLALAKASIVQSTKGSISLTGYYAAGDGGRAQYRRVTGPPLGLGTNSFQSLDGAYWQLAVDEPAAAMFGAKGDGGGGGSVETPPHGTDDAPAIQMAVDTATYAGTLVASGNGGAFARLDAKIHLVGSTIQMGYGNTYLAPRLKGAGAGYQGGGNFGTTLLSNFSNAAAVAINGGRNTQIRDIGFFGLNFYWNNAFVGTAASGWIDPDLAASAGSQYAPYAAIVIDGYRHTGSIPTPHYPDQVFPSWLGYNTQYNAALSSETLIDNCDIAGFVVGVMNNPSNFNQNTDFTRIHNTRIINCAYGVAVGNSQSRNLQCESVLMALVHTGFTNNAFGLQLGKFQSPIINCSVSQCIEIFSLSMGIGGPFTMIDVYGENVYSIGSLTGASSVETCLTMIDCEFSFEYQMLNGIANGLGVPIYVLSASGASPLIIHGGSLVSFVGVLFIQLPVSGVEILGTLLESRVYAGGTTAAYVAFATNALAGGLVFPALGYAVPPGRIRPKYGTWNLDTLAAQSVTMPEVYAGNRSFPTPLWCTSHTAFNQPDLPRIEVPTRVFTLDVTASVIVSASQTGKTLTLTMAVSWTADNFMVNGPSNGDVLLDPNTGSVYFVSDVSGTTVTAVMQNNLQADNLTPIVVPTYAANAAIYCGNSRFYTPANRISGNLLAGSPVITYVGSLENSSGSIATTLAVGDYIAFNAVLDGVIEPSTGGGVSRWGVAKITKIMDGILTASGTYTAGGSWTTSSTSITLSTTPGNLVAGMGVYDTTNNKLIGTVGAGSSGTTVNLVAAAAFASSGASDGVIISSMIVLDRNVSLTATSKVLGTFIRPPPANA